jgi:hypothetical protein
VTPTRLRTTQPGAVSRPSRNPVTLQGCPDVPGTAGVRAVARAAAPRRRGVPPRERYPPGERGRSLLRQHRAQPRQRGRERVVRWCAEPHDQGGTSGARRGVVRRHRVDGETARRSRLDERVLVPALRQLEHGVHAGSDSRHPHLRSDAPNPRPRGGPDDAGTPTVAVARYGRTPPTR